MNVKAAKASQRFHMLARFPFALPLLNVMLPMRRPILTAGAGNGNLLL
jgi:hypothetical protein